MSGYYSHRGDDLEDVSQLHYNRLSSISDSEAKRMIADGGPVVYIHDMLSGGDYGNDALYSRANVNSFHNNVSDEWASKLYWDVVGGHGGFGIAVLGAVMDESSPLYEQEDEELTDAATSIRDLVEGLDDYALINDEEHSNLEMAAQTEQFPAAAFDIYVREAPGTPSGTRTTTLPRWIGGVFGLELDEETLVKLDEISPDADNGVMQETLGALQAFYFQLGGDLFSVYPSTEGGGDNVSIVFSFDDLMIKFGEAVSALREMNREATKTLAALVVNALFAPDGWKAFDYNGQVYVMLREGQKIARMRSQQPGSYAVLADAALMNPPKAQGLLEKGMLVEAVQAGQFGATPG
ncbi:MAG: hypothetical protein WAV09_03065 [Minisyncoccia bacterium]